MVGPGGVVVGVIVAMVMFARRVPHFTEVIDVSHDDETRVYKVVGELFFASSNDLVYQFDYAGDRDHVVIDMSDSHIWDTSTVAALDAIGTKYERKGKRLEIRGLNEASTDRHQRLAGTLGGR